MVVGFVFEAAGGLEVGGVYEGGGTLGELGELRHVVGVGVVIVVVGWAVEVGSLVVG